MVSIEYNDNDVAINWDNIIERNKSYNKHSSLEDILID